MRFYEGLGILEMLSNATQIIKEKFEKTIPSTYWNNQALLYEDKMNPDITPKQIMDNAKKGKYYSAKKIEYIPKKRVVINDRVRYEADVKEYGKEIADSNAKLGLYSFVLSSTEKQPPCQIRDYERYEHDAKEFGYEIANSRALIGLYSFELSSDKEELSYSHKKEMQYKKEHNQPTEIEHRIYEKVPTDNVSIVDSVKKNKQILEEKDEPSQFEKDAAHRIVYDMGYDSSYVKLSNGNQSIRIIAKKNQFEFSIWCSRKNKRNEEQEIPLIFSCCLLLIANAKDGLSLSEIRTYLENKGIEVEKLDFSSSNTINGFIIENYERYAIKYSSSVTLPEYVGEMECLGIERQEKTNESVQFDNMDGQEFERFCASIG